jgi:hypothetical protein
VSENNRSLPDDRRGAFREGDRDMLR